MKPGDSGGIPILRHSFHYGKKENIRLVFARLVGRIAQMRVPAGLRFCRQRVGRVQSADDVEHHLLRRQQDGVAQHDGAPVERGHLRPEAHRVHRLWSALARRLLVRRHGPRHPALLHSRTRYDSFFLFRLKYEDDSVNDADLRNAQEATWRWATRRTSWRSPRRPNRWPCRTTGWRKTCTGWKWTRRRSRAKWWPPRPTVATGAASSRAASTRPPRWPPTRCSASSTGPRPAPSRASKPPGWTAPNARFAVSFLQSFLESLCLSRTLLWMSSAAISALTMSTNGLDFCFKKCNITWPGENFGCRCWCRRGWRTRPDWRSTSPWTTRSTGWTTRSTRSRWWSTTARVGRWCCAATPSTGRRRWTSSRARSTGSPPATRSCANRTSSAAASSSASSKTFPRPAPSKVSRQTFCTAIASETSGFCLQLTYSTVWMKYLKTCPLSFG